jgi:hypothetical protein
MSQSLYPCSLAGPGKVHGFAREEGGGRREGSRKEILEAIFLARYDICQFVFNTGIVKLRSL